MSRSLKIRIYIIVLCIVLVSFSAKAQVNVESRIDSKEIQIGEQTGLKVCVKAKDGARIEFPVYKPQQDIAPDIEVVAINNDTTDADNGMKTYSREYILTSWEEGKHEIPVMTVKVSGKPYKTNSIPLSVSTVNVDTTNVENIKPAKDVQDNPFSWADWVLPFWLTVLAVLLMLAAYYINKRLAKNKPIIIRHKSVKKLLPHQKALNAIEQVKKEHLAHSEDQKLYYTRLTDILRNYLAERFGFNAMEMTSADIISRLRKENQTKIEELREVFDTADLVKFARYSTQVNINDMYLDTVMGFISETKLEQLPVAEKANDDFIEKERKEIRDRKITRFIMLILVVASIAVLTYTGWLVYDLLSI